MILNISTLELSIISAAVATISVVAIGVNAAPKLLEDLNEETLLLNNDQTNYGTDA